MGSFDEEELDSELNRDEELDNELQKSIEKLVDEETSVAKAFVDRNIIKDGLREIMSDPDLIEKTQVIPDLNMQETKKLDGIQAKNIAKISNETEFDQNKEIINEAMKADLSHTDLNLDDSDMKLVENSNANRTKADNRTQNSVSMGTAGSGKSPVNQGKTDKSGMNTSPQQAEKKLSSQQSENRQQLQQSVKNQQNKNASDKRQLQSKDSGRPDSQSGKNKKKLDKKTKVIIAGVCALVIAIIAIMLVIFTINSKNKKNTYEYNYSKGVELYNQKNYTSALPYLKKADELSTAKKNVDLKFKIYDCYIADSQDEEAVKMLENILACDKYNENAIKYLAAYYVRIESGDKMNALIQKYKGTDGEKYLSQYVVDCPVSSEIGGSYNEELDVTLSANENEEIYYTTDGTEPTKDSTLYTDPVHMDVGETTLKAVAINKIGTMSDAIVLEFKIEFDTPDAPVINPASGTYEAGQMIEITNIKDGETAFYTLDGSTPSGAATEYTGPFAMPEGNTVVSVVILNEHNLESSITKRNYNVAVSKSYTFDEAVELLKAKMITNGDLKADGSTLTAGGNAKFIYYAKKTVNNTEMYLSYFDIVVNNKANRQSYYYGVSVKTGQCYKVTESSGTFTAVEY